MIRKLIFFLLMCQQVSACDICGYFPGLIPNESKSYIGISYRYRALTNSTFAGNDHFPDGALRTMHDTHTGSSVHASSAYEIYRTTELKARYFLHPRVEMNLILPYLYNTARHDSIFTEADGIGDITLMAGYQVFDNVTTGAITHRLQTGAGIKFPTARIDRTDSDHLRIDPLLQTGTGSTDLYLYLNYGAGFKNWGLMANGNLKFNGENRLHERVGDSYSFMTGVFYRKSFEKWTVVPSVQVAREYTAGLYLNDILQKGTSMNLWMGGAGADVFIGRVGLNITWLMPLKEYDVTDGFSNRCKYVAGLTWNFTQEKFVIREKDEGVDN